MCEWQRWVVPGIVTVLVLAVAAAVILPGPS